MKNVLVFVTSFVMLSTGVGQVVTPTEYFNAALGSNWQSPTYGPPPNASQMSLVQGSNVLNWSTTSLAANTIAQANLRFNATLPYDQNWSVQLYVNNPYQTTTTTEKVDIGLFLQASNSPTNNVKVVYMQENTTGAPYSSSSAHPDSYHTGLHGTDLAGTTQLNYVSSAGVRDGTVKISFDASTHNIVTSYATGSSTTFTTFGTYNITNNSSGVDAYANWGTVPAFFVSVYADALKGESLTFSGVTADNFYASNFTAIPEPSTYAALFGIAVLGFAAWRRRRQS